MLKSIIFTFSFIFLSNLYAYEARTLGRSPRGLLMGDAYTSIASDEFTLFYNPAILARHKGFSFTPLNPSFAAPNILQDQDRFSNLGGDPENFADVALGYPIYLGGNMAPGFKMGNFGLSAILNMQTNVLLQNQVNPTIKIDHRYDKGFIMGYGKSLSGSYTDEMGGEHFAIGGSIKYINREAINSSNYLLGTTFLDALSAGEISDILSEIGMVNGQGWGFDVAFDYAKSNGSSTFTAGLALLDIYTLLQTESNEQDFEVQTQPMQINFGTAWMAKFGGGFDLTISADIRNLERQMEFMKRVRLGTEIGISPAISLFAGLSGLDNYSYGVKANLGIIKVFTGFYGEDIGEKLDQVESNRFMIYLSLFDFTFDPL
jgi:hypothetical protein